MKKVGIITIYDLNNYGNRLQNYAVHYLLKKMGFNAISYTYEIQDDEFTTKMFIKRIFHKVTRYHFTPNSKDWRGRIQRKINFKRFTKKYIPTHMVSSLEGLSDKADFFVVGSDQVWNPIWYAQHEMKKDMYLLSFARPEQKVCFSPSFGTEDILDEWKPWFKEHLETFPQLTVREMAGAAIIQRLTGQKAQVTIDPTLMLDKKDWLRIAKKPYGINMRKPYILTYFLGKRSEQVQQDIVELLKQKNRTVYHLLDRSQPELYACGPSEFLYMISRADIILTDSFHACVFSFIFNKPFLVYDRNEEGVCCMNSRLDTLLSLLKIERKYRNNGLTNDWFECNYAEGYIVLEKEREKITALLRESLNIE